MLQPPPRRRPPGPRGIPLLGHSWHFARDALGLLASTAKEYGDFAFLRLGGSDVYFVTNPELVRDMLTVQRAKFEIASLRSRLEIVLGKGMLTSRGELHARQRRLMLPVFRKTKIDSYAGLMAEYAERHCERWQPGGELDFSAAMQKLTMVVAAKTLFDYEAEDNADTVARSLATLLGFFSQIMSPFLYASLKFPLPSTLRFRKARRELDAVVYGIIEHRRKHGSGSEDLLTLLMQAKDDETNVFMSEQQLRDELVTLLLVGHETTANALSWTLYLLAQHPQLQVKLHAEVKQVLAGRSRVEAADVGRLAYARQVILEALRLYPPVWIVGRHALSEVKLGQYTVPKGANVLTSQFVVHRDPRTFDDPHGFRPERWTEQFMKSLPLGAYFPFSAGERHCIGEGFAWLEAVIILATLAHRWRFELVAGQTIRPLPTITLRPNTGIRVRPHRW
jgi:cytochrome P450